MKTHNITSEDGAVIGTLQCEGDPYEVWRAVLGGRATFVAVDAVSAKAKPADGH